MQYQEVIRTNRNGLPVIRQLIKTDKNGTKYWVHRNVECTRCGESYRWVETISTLLSYKNTMYRHGFYLTCRRSCFEPRETAFCIVTRVDNTRDMKKSHIKNILKESRKVIRFCNERTKKILDQRYTKEHWGEYFINKVYKHYNLYKYIDERKLTEKVMWEEFEKGCKNVS